MSAETQAPRFFAFYCHKGGAGRSMLAANVAYKIAEKGKNVLLVDWDIEAPGIGNFFDLSKSGSAADRWRTSSGVFDLLAECRDESGVKLLDKVTSYLSVNVLDVLTDASGNLKLLGPGNQTAPDFATAQMSADWNGFYAGYSRKY
jgi:MinD-like ATPase involved in chromosome partitioning or flagellar assembly